MPKFRLESIAELARQLAFSPADVRLIQIGRVEELLGLIDPTKAYPLEFVVFKITEYRPKDRSGELLTGIALQHDLGLLLEEVSDGMDLHTGGLAEPVLDIEDVAGRFNVTSKTIQRWRRRGLPARRFIFPDGKRRVGFLLGSVEGFLAKHGDQLAGPAHSGQMDEVERARVLDAARRLARAGRCCEEEISRRIARRSGRSPLTILHTIRKHDQEYPGQAIFCHAAAAIGEADRAAILKLARRGVGLAGLARRFGQPRFAVYRVLLDARIERILGRKVRFFDDSLFHQDDAAGQIDQMLSQEELAQGPGREELRTPRDLPPCLADLYRTPLLNKSQERALFLKLNFQKYQFVMARRRLDPELVRARDLNGLEAMLARIGQTRNAILRANLRLVVSVARRHLRAGITLAELVSDGNLALMRAVDGFDVGRGHRFSTFATFALMKGFARSVPRMQGGKCAFLDEHLLDALPDGRQGGIVERLAQRDDVGQLLGRLSERERGVIRAHFGLLGQAAESYEQLAQRLGVSKERIRQIEQGALAKLRTGAR